VAWSDLFAGLAFYLIIEGLIPFASPQGWRRGLVVLAQLDDQKLRTTGLVIVVLGLLLLYLVRG
jgi:uncharacterized protein